MNKKPFYIAVDFDGTIVAHEFPDIGSPVPGAVEWLKRFREAGAILILWTMRSDRKEGRYLSEALDYCKSAGIEITHINKNPQEWTTSPKAYAHVYIDDAGFGCPLRENPKMGGKPYVDWDIVGPVVLSRIKAH